MTPAAACHRAPVFGRGRANSLTQDAKRGYTAGMASKKTESLAPWAVHQLRRIRSVYAAGVALWGVGAVLEASERPGSREMWVSVLFLVVFAGLLSATLARLRRHQSAARLPLSATFQESR